MIIVQITCALALFLPCIQYTTVHNVSLPTREFCGLGLVRIDYRLVELEQAGCWTRPGGRKGLAQSDLLPKLHSPSHAKTHSRYEEPVRRKQQNCAIVSREDMSASTRHLNVSALRRTKRNLCSSSTWRQQRPGQLNT